MRTNYSKTCHLKYNSADIKTRNFNAISVMHLALNSMLEIIKLNRFKNDKRRNENSVHQEYKNNTISFHKDID